MTEHEGREARFNGRLVNTPEELDALPPETSLLDERTGAPWGLHWRFAEGAIRDRHRRTLIGLLPLKITDHPGDRLVEMRQWALTAHDAEVRAVERKATGERIANETLQEILWLAVAKEKQATPDAGSWAKVISLIHDELHRIARADTGAGS